MGDRQDCLRVTERRRVGANQCPERSIVSAMRLETRQRVRRVLCQTSVSVLSLSTTTWSIAQHCVANGEPSNFASSSLMNEHSVIYYEVLRIILEELEDKNSVILLSAVDTA